MENVQWGEENDLICGKIVCWNGWGGLFKRNHVTASEYGDLQGIAWFSAWTSTGDHKLWQNGYVSGNGTAWRREIPGLSLCASKKRRPSIAHGLPALASLSDGNPALAPMATDLAGCSLAQNNTGTDFTWTDFTPTTAICWGWTNTMGSVYCLVLYVWM